MESAFRVNSPTVVSEAVDGEVVMIHLDSGNYYSLRGTAAAIWEGIEQGATIESLASTIAGTSGNGPEIAASLPAFVAELLAEELIVPADGVPASSNGAPALPRELEPPVLEKYTDMQHLILLDPVHEVDQGEGWPRARDDA